MLKWIRHRILLWRVNKVLKPFGCKATGIGPNSVGAQGDHRVYGPTVYVSFPSHFSMEQIAEASNTVTNNVVRGKLTRVLMNVPTNQS